jgi:hypothetical protein
MRKRIVHNPLNPDKKIWYKTQADDVVIGDIILLSSGCEALVIRKKYTSDDKQVLLDTMTGMASVPVRPLLKTEGLFLRSPKFLAKGERHYPL